MARGGINLSLPGSGAPSTGRFTHSRRLRLRSTHRLPWVPVEDGDNYRTLAATSRQAHVDGVASPGLVAWCSRAAGPPDPQRVGASDRDGSPSRDLEFAVR
jgi:hypothetical protein